MVRDEDFPAVKDAVMAIRHARMMRERKMHESKQRLEDAVREAAKLGVPKTELAEYAGLSRPTIYEILKS